MYQYQHLWILKDFIFPQLALLCTSYFWTLLVAKIYITTLPGSIVLGAVLLLFIWISAWFFFACYTVTHDADMEREMVFY